MSLRTKIIAAMPFICLITFFLLGFIWGLWHPGWIVFFLIPISPFLLGVKKLKNIYPILCALAYLLMGFLAGWWHPGWIIFLTIPVVEIFLGNNKELNEEDE